MSSSGASGGGGGGLPASAGVDDLIRLLETAPDNVVQDIEQLVRDQLSESKDSWLVHFLYDHYVSSESAKLLKLLLSVPDPHDKHLLDRLAEGVRCGGAAREAAFSVLGFVVRKQPPWLPTVCKHALMKEWIKVLKSEEDLVVLLSALLDLLALMPVLPAHLATYLHDFFEIFSRLASWGYQFIKCLPEIQQVHVQVGLYAFFHRLYGMFPCNFLSYLRFTYSESNKDNQLVFVHTIRPMLNTVRMHPLLVTHSRDLERTPTRWKRLELHDVLVESSRYSLISQESTKEENEPPELEARAGFIVGGEPPDLNDLCSALALGESLWTPGRRLGVSTPPPAGPAVQRAADTRKHLDSPPETAIEATPESTPFVTPVKDEPGFKFARPGPAAVASTRQLRMDLATVKSRAPAPPGASSRVNPWSPAKDQQTCFKYESQGRQQPPPATTHLMRRDSLFERPENHATLLSKLQKVTTDRETSTPQEKEEATKEAANSLATGQRKPSPLNFTSERPEQFPIKPEPERPATGSTDGRKILENLKSWPDLEKEEDDDEVTEITGGNELERTESSRSTRHITPQICADSSASTSRAVSRISAAGSNSRTGTSAPTPVITSAATVNPQSSSTTTFAATASSTTNSECRGGGLHPPNSASVTDFVRQVRGRIRYFSVCGPATDIANEVASVVAAINEEPSTQAKQPKRSSSCPNVHQLKEAAMSKSCIGSSLKIDAAAAKKASTGESAGNNQPESADEKRPVLDTSVQTDEFQVFPYEHLFPSVLPQWFIGSQPQGPSNKEGTDDNEANPYQLLDDLVRASAQKDGRATGSAEEMKTEIKLLHNLMLYERHRRETLGLRNSRLLGKTKSSRVLEEQNTALREQLHILESETAALMEQLETVRMEKHEVEEARAKAAKKRVQQIEELVSENSQLKEEVRHLTEKTKTQTEELSDIRREKSNVEHSLFDANSKITCLEEKEEIRQSTEAELVHLRKEILLLGELLEKYQEKLREAPSTLGRKQEALFAQAFEGELANMKNKVDASTAEAEATKGKLHELEQSVLKKDLLLAEQKRMMKRIKEENQENILALEAANAALQDTQVQLETQILELQAQIARPAVRRIGGGAMPSHRGIGGAASANVDIQRPQVIPARRVGGGGGKEASSGATGSDDKPFIVGSPPLSSAGSLGSDHSELMRRILSSERPVNLESLVDLDESAAELEVGSAVSAREHHLGTSDSSSMNGKKH